MGTRSKIGVVTNNNNVRSIYCHWDGYPEGVGAFLVENYSNVESLNKLMDGGDLSSIYCDHDWKQNKVNPPRPLYFNERGEETFSQTESYTDFKTCARGEEYVYLFDGHSWQCWDYKGLAHVIPKNLVSNLV